MFGERPVPLPDGLVEMIMTSIDADGHLRFKNDYYEGSNVRLLSGPFENLIGRIKHLNDTGRVTILLEIMGRHVPIRLDTRELTLVV
jgi:transcriptional antiterminator RfaH